jgi:hypothetical protein
MGLADLHIHTIYSPDGTSTVSAVLKYAAHHTKLDVIAITDHDKIEGALRAVDLAPSYGIEVIPGIEISSAEGHVLALFVSRLIPAGLSLERTVLKTLELGGACIVPHPMFDSRMGVNPYNIRRALQNPSVVAGLVGFEAFNAGMAGSQRAVDALRIARQLPVAQVGSSDAHINWMIGHGATQFPGQTAADLRQALVERQTTALGTDQMTMKDMLFGFIPRLVLRYAGWVSWNATPSEPLRFVWSGLGGRRLKQTPIPENSFQTA